MSVNTQQVMRMMLEEMSSWTLDNSRSYISYGICARLDIEIRRKMGNRTLVPFVDKILPKIFKDWSKFSGEIDYPISTSDYWPPETCFCYCYNKWISIPSDPIWMQEYVAMRWELVAFCIEWLEHELSIERTFDHENF